jgi:hypothetical protein
MYVHQTRLRRETVEGTETIPTGFASFLEAIFFPEASAMLFPGALAGLYGFANGAHHEALLAPLRHSRVAAPLPGNHTQTHTHTPCIAAYTTNGLKFDHAVIP